jgi:hypothetical protein
MDTSWFELRVNYEKVAAFSYGPSGQTALEAYEKAFALLEVTRADLYKDKMMQVVDVRGLKGERIVHDDCPDVLKPVIPNHTNSTPFDLMVL